MKYQVTCRSYLEHNCDNKHKNKKAQFSCYFNEGFSIKQVRLGEKQPGICTFEGIGDWAVVHAVDVRGSKNLPEAHTRYKIKFFERLDDACDYWRETKAKHGEQEKCSTQCVGVYPHILTMNSGWPVKDGDELRWPREFVKNLYFYERGKNTLKNWITTAMKERQDV